MKLKLPELVFRGCMWRYPYTVVELWFVQLRNQRKSCQASKLAWSAELQGMVRVKVVCGDPLCTACHAVCVVPVQSVVSSCGNHRLIMGKHSGSLWLQMPRIALPVSEKSLTIVTACCDAHAPVIPVSRLKSASHSWKVLPAHYSFEL